MTFLSIVKTEWMKVQWGKLSPLLVLPAILSAVLSGGMIQAAVDQMWEAQWVQMVFTYSVWLYPMVAGVIAAWVCRYEHVGGGLKQFFTLPVSKWQLYWAKLVIVLFCSFLMQLAFGVSYVANSLWQGAETVIPWSYFLWPLLIGWIAILPTIALQIFLSLRFESMGGSLAFLFCVTLPTILIANSADYGPWYPWAQPFLAMMPKGDGGPFAVGYGSLFLIVGGSALVFALVGTVYTQRRTA
ncbi:ABC transporter permease [Bacillus fonticola]|uniref:ABC transporter permease n=1 Tax=Bacillus fonticola TaxID=2728853 RepID=UPI001472CA7A|nr:ABC transporter permease [Bacillus fonticola]